MNIVKRTIATLLFLLCAITTVNSAEVSGLYQAEVTVSNQSEGVRSEALQRAFKEVLVKVSGSQSVLQSDDIKRATQSAQSYLRAYQYDTQTGQLIYVGQFDRAKVDAVVRNAGFPLWDKRRPDIVLWWVLQEPGTIDRQIITSEQYPELVQSAILTARQRGLPLSLPLWDLNDIMQLDALDIWADFGDRVWQASRRYEAQYGLSVRFIHAQDAGAEEQTDSWVAHWSLQRENQVASGVIEAQSRNQLASDVIHAATDAIAARYAIDPSSQSDNPPQQIVIENMKTLRDYVNATALLDSLSVVSKATLISQQGHQATFELNLLGSVDDLANALRLSQQIAPERDDFGRVIESGRYLWRTE